jgi:putative transposase
VATVSCGKTSERFGFVQRYREIGVKRLCNWLEVSPSGFYAWEKREAAARFRDDQKLLKRITRLFWESNGRYGSPRVFNKLRKQGVNVSRKRVERLMREAGLKGRVVRVTRRAPGLKRFKGKGENLLIKMDAPTCIDQVWVADVTYLKLNGNWQYLATLMDLYSRRILGWSLSATRTTKLTTDALGHALKKRQYPKGIVFHTDRGIEYTGGNFQALLKKHDFKHSLNRPGHCTDNAFMESFFHSLKAELICGTTYKNAADLRRSLATYINNFYNTNRLHSGLDYLSPIEYEQRTA